MKNCLYRFAALALLFAASHVSAQSVPVGQNGTLTDSTYSNTVVNDLDLSVGTSGFNFSGSTGSFALPTTGGAFSSSSGASSASGYYYADYLINVSGSSADSVTTSLQNMSGVNNLSERIYTYDPTKGSNGFLGDSSLTAAGVTGIEVWSTNYPLQGAEISIVSPTDLTAGNYVVELRGTNIGNFGGTLSITPVPEPGSWLLWMTGLFAVAAVARPRRSAGRFGESSFKLN